MTDNKKEVERAELHRTIWAIADEMRGSVDGISNPTSWGCSFTDISLKTSQHI